MWSSNTGLKPIFDLNTANHGYETHENFLYAAKIILLKEAFQCRRFKRRISKELKNPKLSVSLQKEPTPPASFLFLLHIIEELTHLEGGLICILPKVIGLFDEAKKERVYMDMLNQEGKFVRQSLSVRTTLDP